MIIKVYPHTTPTGNYLRVRYGSSFKMQHRLIRDLKDAGYLEIQTHGKIDSEKLDDFLKKIQRAYTSAYKKSLKILLPNEKILKGSEILGYIKAHKTYKIQEV